MTTMTANHNINDINWVAGMSDPGEMIRCGAYQQLRRHAGETDQVYQARITVLLADLPQADREKIVKAGRYAAINRAKLDVSNGRVSVMTVGEMAWHGVGVNVSEAQNGESAMNLSNTNWTNLKLPVFLDDGTQVPNIFALVRSDTRGVLGSAGKTYKAFQNHELFELMEAVMGTTEAIFETAGAIKGGKMVWALARLPKTVKVKGADDETMTYALIVNDHTGKGSLRIILTTVRAVCANTLNLALGKATNGGGFTLKHCSTLEGRVRDIREKLGLFVERIDEFQAEVDALAAKSMMETEVTEYLHELFPVKRAKPGESKGVGHDIVAEFLATKDSVGQDIVEEYLDKQSAKNAEVIKDILDLYHNDPSNNMEGVSGTAWSLYNAVSQYCDHKRPARGKDDENRNEARVYNNIFGVSNDIKQDAYQSMLKRFKN